MEDCTPLPLQALDPQKYIFVLLDKSTSLVYGFTVAEILCQRDAVAVAHRFRTKSAANAVLLAEDFPAPEFPPETHESLAYFLDPEVLTPGWKKQQKPSKTGPVNYFGYLRDIIAHIDYYESTSSSHFRTNYEFIEYIKKRQ